MPKKPTKGTKQLGAELDSSLVDQFRAYAKARGEAVRYAMERAIRREIAYPPSPPAPPPVEPLPDSPAADPPKKGRKTK